MTFDFTTLTAREIYPLMISTITPRPIAWVSTLSEAGVANLAPFSYFNAVCANPPTLMFSVANHPDGRSKDTIRNIEAVPEFVVNLVPFGLVKSMVATSAMLPPDESEFARGGVADAPSTRVRPARVAEAPVAFECTLHTIVSVGEGAGAASVVFGRIVAAHVADLVLGADGRIDPALLDTVGRLGGEHYVTTRDRFSLKRPDRK